MLYHRIDVQRIMMHGVDQHESELGTVDRKHRIPCSDPNKVSHIVLSDLARHPSQGYFSVASQSLITRN